MAQTILMPKLGQTVEEASIVKWFKQVGDPVKKGDILFEIETDKAVLESESFFEGTLLKIVVPEGVTVPVQSVVGYIGAEGESVPDAPPPPPPAPPPPAQTDSGDLTGPTEQPTPTEPKQPTNRSTHTEPAKPAALPPETLPAPAKTLSAAGSGPARRLVISPRARALARASAIDPAPIPGTGPGGRIVERDVRDWLTAQDYASRRIAPAALKLAQEHAVDVLHVRGSGDGGRILCADIERAHRQKPQPLSKIRRIIAQRLSESFASIPHFYVSASVDMTELMALRTRLKAEGISYSVNDFVLQAVVLALEATPVMNSRTDGRSITWNGDVDLGVAVSLERGLVVPVVRAAQRLTLTELRDQVRHLAGRARAGSLTPDEMTGGSFTVSNMGMLDIDAFNAIINPGEAGILAVASIREVPAVVNGTVAVRARMTVTLSADHRIVDGAAGAAFINTVKSNLEDMELWKSLTLS